MEIARTASSALQAASQDPIQAALQRPVERFERQAESTRVQLSAFGRLRASTAAVEDAARGLQPTDKPRNADETRAVARRFVDAVNTNNRVVSETTAAGDRQTAAGALANDARARSAAGEVRQAVSSARNNGAEDLRRIGINVDRDGRLAIDQKKFDQALQDNPNAVNQTLDRIGARVASAAARPNAEGGSIDRAVDALSTRASSFEARRDEAQARADASQRSVQRQTSPFQVGGAAAYRGVFGL